MAKHKMACAVSAFAMTMGVGILASAGAWADSVNLAADLTLDGDVENCYTVQTGSSVTIDLNKHNITCTGANAITVEDGATLTIKGDGTVTAKTNSKAAIFNSIGGTVNIESGTYLSEKWYTVKNLGTMTIENGIFNQGTNNTSNASLIDNGWYDGKGTSANDQNMKRTDGAFAIMTINNGTFNHLTSTATIKSDDYSKTNINGGTFDSQNGYLLQASGEVEVTDGNFNGYKSLVIFIANGEADFEPGIATIKGGDAKNVKYLATIDSGYANTDWRKGTLIVTGGNFTGLSKIINLRGDIKGADSDDGMISGGAYSIEPDAAYIIDGYKTNAVGETFVVAKTPVAEDETGGDQSEKTANKEAMNADMNEAVTKLGENYENLANDSVISLPSGGEVKVVDANALKNALMAGHTLTVGLVNNGDVSNTITVAESDALYAILGDDATTLGVFDFNVGIYDEDGTLLANMTELSNELTVSYDVSNVTTVASGYTRTWQVVRYHDGVAEKIDCTYDESTGKISFKTNAFSSYMIAYTDTSVATTPETGTVTRESASAMSATLMTAIAVGVITSIVSFTVLIRRR